MMARALYGRIIFVILMGFAGGVQAKSDVGLLDGAEGLLFRVQGSNTVGASLMKNFLLDYFAARGVVSASVTQLGVENEYRVRGRYDGRAVYVDVAAHGSSTGFQGLLDNTTDIAMASRRIKDGEVSGLAADGDMRRAEAEHVLAIDGLAVIINPANPISQLSLEQIGGIFSGTIRDWREVGGIAGPITLYARDHNSGTWDTFKSLVLAKKYTLADSAMRFESNDLLSDRVSSDTHGIGFVGLASVRDAKTLGIYTAGTQPLLPNVMTVATEDYLLSRRLYLYTPPARSKPQIRDFIAYTQTDRGQEQVAKTGFIAQSVQAVTSSDDRQGPQQYLDLTQKAERLSVNFRFAEGSAELDNKALRDIQRLKDFMSRPENASKRLALIGFGDEKQTQIRAEVLSRLRATAVKAALHRQHIATLPVAGFGAFLPVAANEGKSRLKNQRVEVWLL